MSLLCDIGNSFAHFYDGKRVWRVRHDELVRYEKEQVCYINVSERVKALLRNFKNWIDLEPFIELKSEYEGLGVDRKALCLAIDNGVVVDAGSAVTVDLMCDGVHKGGFIYPGFAAMRYAYASISPRLDVEPEWVESLPQKTSQAVGYGMLHPLLLAIKELGEPIYLTGGDGVLLHRFIEGSIYDEALIFKGLKRVKDGLC